jgi:hypothetical protein
VVVDRAVQVGVADSAGAWADTFGGAVRVSSPAVNAPATTGGNAAKFLDIDVDHRAGGLVFKAHHFAELFAGGRVDVT